jgi:hypothetical protein
MRFAALQYLSPSIWPRNIKDDLLPSDGSMVRAGTECAVNKTATRSRRFDREVLNAACILCAVRRVRWGRAIEVYHAARLRRNAPEAHALHEAEHRVHRLQAFRYSSISPSTSGVPYASNRTASLGLLSISFFISTPSPRDWCIPFPAVISSIGLWGPLQNPEYLRIVQLLREIEGVEAPLVLDAGIGIPCDQ